MSLPIAKVFKPEDYQQAPAESKNEPGSTDRDLAAILAARRFNFDERPEKPIAMLKLAGHPLTTDGNITNCQGGPKMGKSTVIAAILGATIRGTYQGSGDCLGFESDNPDGKAVIHFDTEQSRYDADALIRRSIQRAGMGGAPPPPWLFSYSLADVDTNDRRKALAFAMDAASESCGGIHAVIIDGVADLCTSLNDDTTAFDLVDQLHKLAIRFDCPIITVLHENPGSEGGKTRGHLGSQLERKAETNLRLVKDGDGITTIFTERSRHCHIPRADGVCFEWSDAAGMHVSCGTAGQIKAKSKRAKMAAEAATVFDDEPMLYTELVAAIVDRLDIKDRAAKGRVKAWRAEGIVRKSEDGKHHLIQP